MYMDVPKAGFTPDSLGFCTVAYEEAEDRKTGKEQPLDSGAGMIRPKSSFQRGYTWHAFRKEATLDELNAQLTPQD